jgi:hypothetical protein
MEPAIVILKTAPHHFSQQFSIPCNHGSITYLSPSPPPFQFTISHHYHSLCYNSSQHQLPLQLEAQFTEPPPSTPLNPP